MWGWDPALRIANLRRIPIFSRTYFSENVIAKKCFFFPFNIMHTNSNFLDNYYTRKRMEMSIFHFCLVIMPASSALVLTVEFFKKWKPDNDYIILAKRNYIRVKNNEHICFLSELKWMPLFLWFYLWDSVESDT